MIDGHSNAGSGAGIVTRNFKVGGMKDSNAGKDIEEMIGKIDGVKQVSADRASQMVSIEFDPGEVTEEWLTETLNTMGHSILSE